MATRCFGNTPATAHWPAKIHPEQLASAAQDTTISSPYREECTFWLHPHQLHLAQPIVES